VTKGRQRFGALPSWDDECWRPRLDVIELSAEGPDASEAVNALLALIAAKFHERCVIRTSVAIRNCLYLGQLCERNFGFKAALAIYKFQCGFSNFLTAVPS